MSAERARQCDVMSDVHQPSLRDRRISNLQHLFHYFINASFTSSYPRHSKSVQLTEDKVSRSPRLGSNRVSCFGRDDAFGVKLVAMIQSVRGSESGRGREREIIYVNDPRITRAYSWQNASASAHTLSRRGLRFATNGASARACVRGTSRLHLYNNPQWCAPPSAENFAGFFPVDAEHAGEDDKSPRKRVHALPLEK